MLKRFLITSILITLLVNVSFGQTTINLDQCKDLARKNNVQYLNSLLDREAAHQTRKAVLTKYFPSISATGMVFRSQDYLMDKSIKGGNLPVYDGDPAHLAGATQFAYFPDMSLSLLRDGKVGVVSAVQPVFAGGRIVNANRLAALGSDVADQKMRLTTNEVILITEQRYWQIVELAEKLATVSKYQTFLDTLVGQVDDAYRAGLILNNDLLKVKTKQSEISVSRSKLENGYALAMMSFCQFIGVPYDSTLKLASDSGTYQPPQSIFVNHSEAIYHRAEYSLLQKSVEAEKLQTKLKVGEYLPTAGIGLAWLYTQFDKDDGTSNGMVFGTVSVPISGWWEASHTIKERKLREQAVVNSARDNQQLLLLQMDKAWRDLTDADKQLNLSKLTTQQAEENLKVAADSYHNGIVTVSDLLEAEAMHQQAVDQLTEANANYRIKLSTYLQVTGR